MVLLLGSNVRKDLPMIGHRVRMAYKNGASIMAINSIDYDFTMKLKEKIIVDPIALLQSLAGVAQALGADKETSLPKGMQSWIAKASPTAAEKNIAKLLKKGKRATLLLGNAANNHCHAAGIRTLAQVIANLAKAKLGYLPEANSVAAWLAGCVPHRGPNGAAIKGGQHLRSMLSNPLKAYLLMAVEPELDSLDGSRARSAMQGAEFVVMMTSFKPEALSANALEYTNALLPMSPFTETDGSYINLEGRLQSHKAAVPPLGETRPGWKILRVLANQLGLDGFDYNTIVEVRAACPEIPSSPSNALTDWRRTKAPDNKSADLIRIAEAPMYVTDMILRRANALQQTLDNPKPGAHVSATQADKLGVGGGDHVVVRMTEGNATLPLVIDKRIPEGCVYVPVGYKETSTLGAHGPVSIVKA